jgi:hypothetical protein
MSRVKSKAKDWIKGAIKHPGALTKQAKKAGTSAMAFAKSHVHAKGKTGQRSRLAMILKRVRP